MLRRNLVLISTLLVLLVVGLGWFARCRHYQERRAVRTAERFLTAGDYHRASLSARQALQTNPANLEACQVMATVAEACCPPETLDWRRRIAEISPTVENKLRWAATALQVQGPPYPVAVGILQDLASTASNQVAYCNLATDLALKLKHREEAEHWIETARRLQPSNEVHQLNLAVLRLDSKNSDLAIEARATLRRLEADTNFAALALRSLVADSLTRNDLPNARQFSQRLIACPGVSLDDDLLHLDILSRMNLPEFGPCLKRLQGRVSTNAVSIYGVCSFLVRHDLAEQGWAWLKTCPREIRETQPVPLAMVECLVALKNWADLENFLKREQWGDFEAMRLAFLSQAAFELHDQAAAGVRWWLATTQARRRLGTLMWLAEKANSWGRPSARLDILWEIAHEFPSERWAWQELALSYLASGDTRRLYEIYANLSTLTPDDVSTRNNFAVTALLLKTNLAKAHAVARQIYVEHSADPIVASTYAYSLHLQSKTREAVAVMERLSPELLASPSIALYYATLLRADGHLAKANEYYARVDRGALLPEERALLTIP